MTGVLVRFALPISWSELLKRAAKETIADDVLSLSAQQAYYFFFSLFPALLTLIALASFFPLYNLTDEVIRTLGRIAPPDLITINVRETWSDYLVTYEGENPFDWNLQGVPQPITARRGPYTVDVTYVLERVADPLAYYQWRVVSMTELTPRPAWR